MLSSQIESILFAADKPIKLKQIAKLCGRSKDEIEIVFESLKNKYNNAENGINILINNDEVQMVSSEANSDLLAEFLKEEISCELTRPQLEALAVIAYRGPISKLDLETIRGVNCSLIIRNLLIKGLIDAIDNNIYALSIYALSMEFIKHLGIKSVKELPTYEELSRREEISEVLDELKTDGGLKS